MYKKIVVMMCFCLVLSLVASGCGGIGDKAIEKTIENLIEAENKANEDKAAEPGPTTPGKPSDQQPPADSGKKDTGDGQVKPGGDKKEIPKDYPSEFCPIYEPSIIIDVTEIRVKELTSYIIEFVSKHEVNTIEGFYTELDHVTDTLRLGDLLCQIYLENESEKISAVINLEPLKDGLASFASEGYKTSATVMVDLW